MTPRLTLFDTPLGRCGIAWGPKGVLGVQLPEPAGTERARLLRHFPDAVEAEPPPELGDVVARIVAHLEGRTVDLESIALDMGEVPEFDRQVYEIARAIPRGETRTYGEVAAALGDRGADQPLRPSAMTLEVER